MSSVVKVLANTITLAAAANNVYNAKLVRILNTGTTPALITQTTNTAVAVGTLIVAANTDVAMQKDPGDTLTSNHASAVLAVKIAFRN